MPVTWNENWRVRRVWRDLSGQFFDCCNHHWRGMQTHIVMLWISSLRQRHTSFMLSCWLRTNLLKLPLCGSLVQDICHCDTISSQLTHSKSFLALMMRWCIHGTLPVTVQPRKSSPFASFQPMASILCTLCWILAKEIMDWSNTYLKCHSKVIQSYSDFPELCITLLQCCKEWWHGVQGLTMGLYPTLYTIFKLLQMQSVAVYGLHSVINFPRFYHLQLPEIKYYHTSVA